MLPRVTKRIEREDGVLVQELRGRGWWAYPRVFSRGHAEPVALVKVGSPRKFFTTKREAIAWLAAYAEEQLIDEDP